MARVGTKLFIHVVDKSSVELPMLCDLVIFIHYKSCFFCSYNCAQYFSLPIVYSVEFEIGGIERQIETALPIVEGRQSISTVFSYENGSLIYFFLECVGGLCIIREEKHP